MSEVENFEIGQEIEIIDKNLKGFIAFIGVTKFASGYWIGVVLDENKGRNDGSVNGQYYFKCLPNHGLFVRPTQIILSNMSSTLTDNKSSATNTTLKGLNIEKAAIRNNNKFKSAEARSPTFISLNSPTVKTHLKSRKITSMKNFFEKETKSLKTSPNKGKTFTESLQNKTKAKIKKQLNNSEESLETTRNKKGTPLTTRSVASSNRSSLVSLNSSKGSTKNSSEEKSAANLSQEKSLKSLNNPPGKSSGKSLSERKFLPSTSGRNSPRTGKLFEKTLPRKGLEKNLPTVSNSYEKSLKSLSEGKSKQGLSLIQKSSAENLSKSSSPEVNTNNFKKVAKNSPNEIITKSLPETRLKSSSQIHTKSSPSKGLSIKVTNQPVTKEQAASDLSQVYIDQSIKSLITKKPSHKNLSSFSSCTETNSLEAENRDRKSSKDSPPESYPESKCIENLDSFSGVDKSEKPYTSATSSTHFPVNSIPQTSLTIQNSRIRKFSFPSANIEQKSYITTFMSASSSRPNQSSPKHTRGNLLSSTTANTPSNSPSLSSSYHDNQQTSSCSTPDNQTYSINPFDEAFQRAQTSLAPSIQSDEDETISTTKKLVKKESPLSSKYTRRDSSSDQSPTVNEATIKPNISTPNQDNLDRTFHPKEFLVDTSLSIHNSSEDSDYIETENAKVMESFKDSQNLKDRFSTAATSLNSNLSPSSPIHAKYSRDPTVTVSGHRMSSNQAAFAGKSPPPSALNFGKIQINKVPSLTGLFEEKSVPSSSFDSLKQNRSNSAKLIPKDSSHASLSKLNGKIGATATSSSSSKQATSFPVGSGGKISSSAAPLQAAKSLTPKTTSVFPAKKNAEKSFLNTTANKSSNIAYGKNITKASSGIGNAVESVSRSPSGSNFDKTITDSRSDKFKETPSSKYSGRRSSQVTNEIGNSKDSSDDFTEKPFASSSKSSSTYAISTPPNAANGGSSYSNSSSSSNSSHHLLKTTKISKPKLLTSNSQLALNIVASSICSGNSIRTDAPMVFAPKRSKTTVSPSESFCCTKRSSFIETGFLEILRPQFTPGHPLRSPLQSKAPSTSNLGLALEEQQRVKTLTSENLQLKEELQVLRQQRNDDKRKLTDLEKLRLQNEQLLEFKTQIMEQHSQLQRDYHRCRQDLQEAHESKAKSKRDFDELHDNIEMLTLDKEMAEEKSETLQIEIEMLHERIEELTLDVEILRAEHESSSFFNENNANNTNPVQDNFQTACEIKRLEQYNQRLRETVIRLRDALSMEKQELQKASKELETKYSEITELKKTKQMLSNRVDLMESHIIDLKEQVDASLGAETMVSSLAEVKLELEDKVKLLEDEVAELEALEEIHEQLIESNQELEQDLREEIEVLNITVKSLQQQKDAALESVYERDITIMKFRELVRSLNEQLRDTGTIVGGTSEDFSSTCSNIEETQSLDFQQVFSGTKAYGRAIDHQLTAIELKLKSQHIEQLLAFVPEKILLRGAEHDVILVLLMFQSLAAKVEILCNGIIEKFPASCEFDKDAIFEGYSVQRAAFRSRSLYILRSLNTLLQQLLFMLQRADYDFCTHAAIYRNEIETQEQRVDELLRLLKSGHLDEHTPCENMEKILGFFNMLYGNLISPQSFHELVDEDQIHSNFLEVLESAVDCINTNACLIHTLVKLGDEQTESFKCMQNIVENMCHIKQGIKKIQRKLLYNGSGSLTFSSMHWDRMQHIQSTNETLGRAINILSATTSDATKELTSVKCDFSNNDISIEHSKLWRILSLHCSKMAPTDEFETPFNLFEKCINLLKEELEAYSDYIKGQESDKSINVKTVYIRASANTLQQRAAQVKQHYQDIQSFENALAEKEKELKTLKYMAKIKQNDFSEMQVRKEILERNLTKQQNDHSVFLQQFVNNLENLKYSFEAKEVHLNTCFDNLERRLKSLEFELDKWQKHLNNKNIKIVTSTNESLQEIEHLKHLIRKQRKDSSELKTHHLKKIVKNFEPIHVPPMEKDQKLKELDLKLRQLKHKWILTLISIEKDKGNTCRNVQRESEDISKKILTEFLRQHPHYIAPSDVGLFAKPEIRLAFQDSL